jgi:Rrf2 family protein
VKEVITRQIDYAIRMIAFMATDKSKKYTTDEISEILDIPRSFLPTIVSSLAAKKIIFTYRGKSGGMKLAKDPSEISVFDVIEAIDGQIVINTCLFDDAICGFTQVCKIRKFWEKLQEELVERLKNTKISDLILDYGKVKNNEF